MPVKGSRADVASRLQEFPPTRLFPSTLNKLIVPRHLRAREEDAPPSRQSTLRYWSRDHSQVTWSVTLLKPRQSFSMLPEPKRRSASRADKQRSTNPTWCMPPVKVDYINNCFAALNLALRRTDSENIRWHGEWPIWSTGVKAVVFSSVINMGGWVNSCMECKFTNSNCFLFLFFVVVVVVVMRTAAVGTIKPHFFFCCCLGHPYLKWEVLSTLT